MLHESSDRKLYAAKPRNQHGPSMPHKIVGRGTWEPHAVAVNASPKLVCSRVPVP